MRNKFLVLSILLLLMFCFANSAAAKSSMDTADKWEYEFTIFGWLPPAEGGSATVDASDTLDNLNFVFMGAGEARYNKLSFGLDVIYMDISNSKSADILVGPDPGVPLSIDG